MKLDQAKLAAKKIAIVGSVIIGICGFIGGIVYLIESDRIHTTQALCAPDGMDHSFFDGKHSRAVCQKSDGTLYLSDKSK